MDVLDAGDAERHGVGARRRMTAGRQRFTEQRLEVVPERRLVYAIEGPGYRDARATITLEPHAAGTLVTWSARLRPPMPGTGPLLRRLGGRLFQRLLDQVADRAERATV